MPTKILAVDKSVAKIRENIQTEVEQFIESTATLLYSCWTELTNGKDTENKIKRESLCLQSVSYTHLVCCV